MRLELPRGMRDLDYEEFSNINYIKERFLDTVSLFNFRFMEPSPLEMVATLEAKGGQSILNEIYGFRDKGNRNIALRFDLTVGLTRFVTSRRDLKMPAKIASFAGVWRYDEPQAGRYRYFHQWDIEVYGSFGIESDIEVIEFTALFMKKLGLDIVIEINDRRLLEEYIREEIGIDSEDKLLEVFRAIDKVPKKGSLNVLKEYEKRIDPLQLEKVIELSTIKGTLEDINSKTNLNKLKSWKNLEGLMDSLKSRGISNARINLGIVRGLDYYSGIVFEAFDPSLDMGALVGGGRYDRLATVFGRPDLGATGAAGGIERIILAMQKHNLLRYAPKNLVYVIYTSDKWKNECQKIVSELRGSGIPTDYDINGRPTQKQFEDAATKGAKLVVIVDDGYDNSNNIDSRGIVTIRSLQKGFESRYKVKDLAKEILDLLD